MTWTEEQLQAIHEEGKNIIVSAGAGSGKTAVLSERVLRKLKDGIDIRNILILTFTNEAAGEMAMRIRKKIKAAGLIEQLEYLDSAYITTFDAFALNIVKKYHYILGISKNVSIIDSSIIDKVKNEFLEEIFLDLYAKKDSDFLKLINDFTTRDDLTIKTAILKINHSLDLKYDKEEYLNHYLENYMNEDYIDQLIKEYFDYLKELCISVENSVYALESELEEKQYLKLYEAYSRLFSPKNYDDLYKVKEIPRLVFRNLSEEAKILREELKTKVAEIMSLTEYKEEELKEQIRSTKEYIKAMIKIILKLDQKLNAYKKEHESFEFIDISKMAIQIVEKNSDICEELKNTYNEILIDEYQDTNDLQEIFIQFISNHNVYMVGDIKQSIYRFRNANPDIFKQKYEKYQKKEDGMVIDLLKNFRSRKEVLTNINEIFKFIMTEEFGGVTYQGTHEMIYGNQAYIKEGENHYNNLMEIKTYENEEKEFSNTEIEAFTIAKDIKNKIEHQYLVYDFDLKKLRFATYQDFCIILDRGTDMPIYKKIFEYFNIPMEVYKDSNLVSSNDILIIKNLIGLVLQIKNKEYNTKMRYYFVSIARSFIGHMTDQEIFKTIENNTFYETNIYQKCFEIAKTLDHLTPNMLLRRLIEDFNFYQNMIEIGNIEAETIRLEYLLDIAVSAEQLGFNISDFKEYLEEMIADKKEITYKEARGMGDCVKIMNIHKSKGLEFPICYFAGFKKDFNLSDLQSRFLFDNQYGILTPYYKEGIGTLITKTLIKNAYYKEEISEKIRLFYVALTRAKEKIIMVMPKPKKALKQTGLVSKELAFSYRSFSDFMASIYFNLSNYITTISLTDLNLTEDYEFPNNINEPILTNTADQMIFKENKVDYEMIEHKHASKTIHNVISYKEAKTLEYGTKMHEMLEETDFKNYHGNNPYINNLLNTFDFKSPIIYQELEFYYDEENIEYHGIIDLMLEYDDHIKIIDYKLKNIEDEAYQHQLNIYLNYLKKVSEKEVKLYLYSIMDNQIKEIPILSVVT